MGQGDGLEALAAVSYAKRRDANHGTIRDGLKRDPRFDVEDTGHVGHGFPDIIVKNRITGRVRFQEIKDPDKPLSARVLTPAERRMQELMGDIYVVVETLEQAVRAMVE